MKKCTTPVSACIRLLIVCKHSVHCIPLQAYNYAWLLYARKTERKYSTHTQLLLCRPAQLCPLSLITESQMVFCKLKFCTRDLSSSTTGH